MDAVSVIRERVKQQPYHLIPLVSTASAGLSQRVQLLRLAADSLAVSGAAQFAARVRSEELQLARLQDSPDPTSVSVRSAGVANNVCGLEVAPFSLRRTKAPPCSRGSHPMQHHDWGSHPSQHHNYPLSPRPASTDVPSMPTGGARGAALGTRGGGARPGGPLGGWPQHRIGRHRGGRRALVARGQGRQHLGLGLGLGLTSNC